MITLLMLEKHLSLNHSHNDLTVYWENWLETNKFNMLMYLWNTRITKNSCRKKNIQHSDCPSASNMKHDDIHHFISLTAESSQMTPMK